MRQTVLTAMFTALVAVAAYADDGRGPCIGSFEVTEKTDDLLPQSAQLHLTDNQCEAAIKREARLPLFEIPQDKEDPMALSLGVKNLGGILRFKIPFSF